MPQSLVKNYIHLVFSTKNRQNTISLEDYPDIKGYVIGILSNLGCYTEEFGGTENHVHILLTLNKNLSMSELVGKLKSNSSHWLHEKGERYHGFGWQLGYGAFSVSQTKVDVVKHYIQNQVEHHRKQTFEDELREFLQAYGLEYDERYVWD